MMVAVAPVPGTVFATSIMLQSGLKGHGAYGFFVDTSYYLALEWAILNASNAHPFRQPGYSCSFVRYSSTALRLPECPVPL